MVDTATGRLLDVVEDRTAKAVSGWLADRDDDWRRQIGVVALDPHRGYVNAISQNLGYATMVVDRWHAIRMANAMVDDVRRRVQQQTAGHRGRKNDPLYRIKRTKEFKEMAFNKDIVNIAKGLMLGVFTCTVRAGYNCVDGMAGCNSSAGRPATTNMPPYYNSPQVLPSHHW